MDKKDKNTFWGRAKPLIKAHKMTQKQFAEYMGISINTLEGWIKYDRVPETTMAYSIAVTLGVTLNYLLGGKERDIATARLKELEARNAAARIAELSRQIMKEAQKLRPLGASKRKDAKKSAS